MALLSPIRILKIDLAFHKQFTGRKNSTVQYIEVDLCSEIQYFLATCCWITKMNSGKNLVPKQIIMACIVTMPSIFHCGKSPVTIT